MPQVQGAQQSLRYWERPHGMSLVNHVSAGAATMTVPTSTQKARTMYDQGCAPYDQECAPQSWRTGCLQIPLVLRYFGGKRSPRMLTQGVCTAA